MKAQFHPVSNNEECERMIRDTYQGVLAMVADGRPYAVPLNHAYRDGRFLFHCADSGRKLEAIEGNPNVSYVVKKYYGDSAVLAKAMRCHGHWESVIAEGTARIVSEDAELIACMKRYMAYYGHDDYQHGDDLLGRTKMIVLDVEHMTARREYDEFRTDYWYWRKDGSPEVGAVTSGSSE